MLRQLHAGREYENWQPGIFLKGWLRVAIRLEHWKDTQWKSGGEYVNIKLLGMAFLLFVFGCSSSSQYMPENNWPSKEASEALANRPVPKVTAAPKKARLVVEQWGLVGELPDHFGYSKPELNTNWEKGVEAIVAQNAKHRMSAAAMCVAQQSAEYFAAYGDFATEGVKQFIGARCGATSQSFGVSWLSYEDVVDPAAAWSDDRAGISKWVGGRLDGSGAFDVGVAARHHDGVLRFFLVNAERSLDFEYTPFVHADSVVIRGTSNVANTASIGATITKGEFGFASCERDSRIAYPAFVFTCPIEASDSFAYVDFSVAKEGRFLASFSGRVMVASATPPQSYMIPAIRRAVAQAPVSQGDSIQTATGLPIVAASQSRDGFSAEVVRVANHVRAQAGLEPLTLAVAQSKFNSKIAPFMFSEEAEADVDSENEASMAVLAGWNVEGFIVDGFFRTLGISNTDPSSYVDAVLESASGRRLLLGPSVSTLAIGTVADGDGVDVLASSYVFLPEMDFNRRVGEALRDLNRLRAQRNLPPLKESIKLRGIARETAARIEKNEIGLDAAGAKMSDQYVLKYHKGCRYWRFVTHDFDDMDFAKEIIETEKGRVSILVAPYRPEGFAWGFYAIVIVVEN